MIDNNSPLFSSLIMTKDTVEDGYLHAFEIYSKKIDAELVVLTACETGKSNANIGEGIVSLAHAFTYAGCPATLMTLWSVDEKSTAYIIDHFYDYLMDGDKKSEALKKAKIDFLESANLQERAPYYWAGIVLIGDDSPLFESSIDKMWWLLIIAILLVIGVLLRKKN